MKMKLPISAILFSSVFIVIVTHLFGGMKIINSIGIPSESEDIFTLVSTEQKSHESTCLSFEGRFKKLVQSSKQLFITYPAKAAGTSLKNFTKDCMGETHIAEDNFFNFEHRVIDTLITNFQLPSIITGHLYNDETLVNLIKGASDNTLLIYSHRHENDRVVSSIKQVVSRLCKGLLEAIEEFESYVDLNGNNCVIQEEGLRDLILQQKLEIGLGVNNTLTCQVYDAIEEHKAKVVVFHYKQVVRLQKLLAEKYCPKLLSKSPIHVPTFGGELNINVKLLSTGKQVTMDEWINAKKELLEWGFGLKKNIQCQGRLRDMEKSLFSCEDEVIQFNI